MKKKNLLINIYSGEIAPDKCNVQNLLEIESKQLTKYAPEKMITVAFKSKKKNPEENYNTKMLYSRGMCLFSVDQIWPNFTLPTYFIRLECFCSLIRGLHHVCPQILPSKKPIIWVDFRHFLNFKMSDLIHSYHVFLGLPRPTRPSTTKLVISFIVLVLRWTWPNQRRRLYRMVVSRSSIPSLFRSESELSQFFRDIPHIQRSIVRSISCSLRMSLTTGAQHSLPYNRTGRIQVL